MKDASGKDCELYICHSFFSNEHRMTLYMVGIVGGPSHLLTRSTREAAIADGAAYVAERWGRTAEGDWTPYPERWVSQ